MENNENLVTEEIVTENTEQTAEETPKTYTQEEVDGLMGKRIARNTAKIHKEYERKNAQYEDLVNTLKAGTGKESVEELIDTFRDFYTKKGIQIQDRKSADYSAKDMEILARADAEDILRYGDEEAAEEFDRLEKLGTKMTKREQETFRILAEHLHGSEMGRELAKIGVTKEEYNSQEFKDFAAKFDRNTPITDVYNIYRQTKPKKEIKSMGSMRNNVPDTNMVKDFYTYEEAQKFTKADFDKNPALYQKVIDSMAKWK
jgi:hypothetical protein